MNVRSESLRSEKKPWLHTLEKTKSMHCVKGREVAEVDKSIKLKLRSC